MITIENLKLLYQKLVIRSKNLSSFRFLTMCILGFCGFMRYSEISNLRRLRHIHESIYQQIQN